MPIRTLSLLVALLCSTGEAGELFRYEVAERHMGTEFKLVFYAPDDKTANIAAEKALTRIGELDQKLSDYRPDSELSRLSDTAGSGRDVPLSEELWTVLSAAQQLSERSEGAFDVTIRPVVSLWREARKSQQLPEPQALEAARQVVGHELLKLNAEKRTARLLRSGMRLDLGGIAKGYACDQALAALRTEGVRSALVDGGGDLAVSDPPPGTLGWIIGVAPLEPKGPPSRFLLLANVGVATSGDAFQHVLVGGQRYSHIVDPRTGIGLTDRSRVTVIAPSGMQADALASTVSVLGPRQGLKLIDETAGTAAHVVRRPDEEVETAESAGFGRFELAAEALAEQAANRELSLSQRLAALKTLRRVPAAEMNQVERVLPGLENQLQEPALTAALAELKARLKNQPNR